MRPVTLYLVRHAIAHARGDEWPDDTKRPLTSRGIARMRRQVSGLRRLGAAIDLVLTSPLVRTAQTADILVEGFKREPKLRALDELAPGHTPSSVAAALGKEKAKRIAIVGHEPGLGELAAWLIGAKAPIEFRKGGAARIDMPSWPPSRDGRLQWLATPRMLRLRPRKA